ncbi:MAG: hypothetical protein MJ077_05930 [Oscillospiraceae bacterium]|nr:hypothetical protein [Oscillospiraceae bacterium]
MLPSLLKKVENLSGGFIILFLLRLRNRKNAEISSMRPAAMRKIKEVIVKKVGCYLLESPHQP